MTVPVMTLSVSFLSSRPVLTYPALPVTAATEPLTVNSPWVPSTLIVSFCRIHEDQYRNEILQWSTHLVGRVPQLVVIVLRLKANPPRRWVNSLSDTMRGLNRFGAVQPKGIISDLGYHFELLR